MLLNDGVKFQARKTLSKILFTCAIYLSPISDNFLHQNHAQNEIFYLGVQSAAGKGLQVVVDPNDLNRLKRGLKEINYLLDNW